MTPITTEQRELLELAAKAAGLSHLTRWSDNICDYDSRHYGEAALHAEGVAGECDSWNPLTDDGDALRLAVKLGMQIDMRDPETRIYAMGAGDVVTEYHANRDALAATRRAIVRAAAALTQGA